MLNSEFDAIANGEIDFHPPELRGEIDAINDFIYTDINKGVYRCGFATTQEAYEEAFTVLFAALDRLEGILEHEPYLTGGRITEVDWRLFTTLTLRRSLLRSLQVQSEADRRVSEPVPLPARALSRPRNCRDRRHGPHQRHYYQSHKTINPIANRTPRSGTGIHGSGPMNRLIRALTKLLYCDQLSQNVRAGL